MHGKRYRKYHLPRIARVNGLKVLAKTVQQAHAVAVTVGLRITVMSCSIIVHGAERLW